MIPQAQRTPAWQFVLPLVGAALGILLAAAGLVNRGTRPAAGLPDHAVARVNGEVIRAEDYQRVMSALAQDRRDALDDVQRRRLLDRLIDEELLVQRGLELGMARNDSKVRKDLTAAVIDSVVAEAGDLQPNEGELQAFYDAHRDTFAGPGRLRVRQIFWRIASSSEAPQAMDRAQHATRRLRAGEDFATVRAGLSDTELAPVPDTMLPPTKLIDYLGPTAARAAFSLEPGAVTEPIRSSSGLHVLQLLAREPYSIPAFADIKPQVLSEYRRQASERALRTYLDQLRAHADVQIAPTLP